MKNDVDPTVDNLPPGRVTDLSVADHVMEAYITHGQKFQNVENDDAVHLWFTSPGDDLDSVNPVDGYTIKYSSTAGNLTGANFDMEEFNVVIAASDLIDSDLTPVAGGAVKEIKISRSTFSLNEKKYVFALVSMDESENRSPVSNIAQLLLSPAQGSSASQLSAKITTTYLITISFLMWAYL